MHFKNKFPNAVLVALKMSGLRAILQPLSMALLILPSAAQALSEPSELDYSLLSRITVAIPFATHHFPHNEDFNDDNWGAFALFSLGDDWSLAAGDFINSYSRNTVFAGVTWLPVNFKVDRVQIDCGGMVGLDLNHGYQGSNSIDPALGALSLKISGKYFDDPHYRILDRLGLLVTVIPALRSDQSTAVNLALTIRL